MIIKSLFWHTYLTYLQTYFLVSCRASSFISMFYIPLFLGSQDDGFRAIAPVFSVCGVALFTALSKSEH